jgi:hypothetical protein
VNHLAKKACKECGEELGEDGVCTGCGWTESEEGETQGKTQEEDDDDWDDDEEEEDEEE